MRMRQAHGSVAVVALVAAAVLAAISGSTLAYNNGIARLPPMGWNTWCTDDICGLIDYCTEDLVKSVADGIVEQGLDKLGYKYINMDDCWSAKTRNATGHLQPNPALFPSGMRALADYIHSKGLKFGLYTCIGTQTCKRGRPGSYGHYEIDAQTVADWGMDFIKTDNCHKPSNATDVELFTQFSKALNATNRRIVFSLCQWGEEKVQTWGGSVGQMWRVQMDHIPLWHFPADAAGAGFGQGTSDIIEYVGSLDLTNLTGPYNHLDPDFLETLFPVTMSFIDSRTEFSFWSLWSAPLLVATDLRNLTEEKKSIVANKEVIAIDQDELSVCGWRLFNETSGAQAWVKPLAGGDIAVILYNAHNKHTIDVTLTWKQLGLRADTKVQVRDLWGQKDLGSFTTQITAKSIQPHDVMMYKFSLPSALQGYLLAQRS